MNTRQDILANLRRLEPSEFLTNYLFDCVPHVFFGDRGAFVFWKQVLAPLLEVDPNCIVFVGSSAIGISLNPSKGYAAFHAGSDIDVAIISHYHFTVAWRYLRSNSHRRASVDLATRTAWDEHVKRFIYWGTIATDRLLGVLPFGQQWLTAATHMSTIPPTIGREVNFRIYEDFESLRAYQLSSTSRSREDLFTQGA